MKKLLLVSLCFLMLCVTQVFAQNRTVTGTVTAKDDGLPVPGVTVKVKGTAIGTQTNSTGAYSLSVPSNAVLEFSFIGYAIQDIPVGGKSTINVVLLTDSKQLNEVIVTSLGIRREKRALGYSIQDVKGDALTAAGETDALKALSGKVAGVQITTSAGTPGAEVYVQLRGQVSFGNNQPLFVVDGIPIDNSFNQTIIGGGTQATQTNRGVDINPDDIESISVLKGPSAAALYGINAANGAIVITTKKGQAGKTQVDVSSGFSFSSVNKLPKLQSQYIKGLNSNLTSSSFTSSNRYSWGANIDTLFWTGIPNAYDVHGNIVGKSNPLAKIPFKPYDNFDSFWQTGGIYDNSVAISGGNDVSTYRTSITNSYQNSIIPTQYFQRTTLNFGGTLQISKRLKATSNISYTGSDGNQPQTGSNVSGIMLGLTRTPISFDNSNGLKDPWNNPASYILPAGKTNNIGGNQRSYRNGTTYDNPYWTINNNPYTTNVGRIIGNITLDYNIGSGLTAQYRFGGDNYQDNRNQYYEIGSAASQGGQILQDRYTFRSLNSDLILGYTKKIGNSFQFDGKIGNNIQGQKDDELFVNGTGLVVPGFRNLANASTITTAQISVPTRSYSFYYDLNFSYKSLLYLETTGRNDHESTLPASNNSFFYPSANLSFVFTELGALKNSEWLSFGKLRGSITQSGHAIGAFATSSGYVASAFTDGFTTGIQYPSAGLASYSLSAAQGNPNIKPELSTAYEIGVQLQFFKNRLGLDATYYHDESKNLALSAPIAGSTGYTSTVLNTGSILNKGFEFQLTGTEVKSSFFNWSSFINFSLNRGKVLALAPGLNALLLGGFGGGEAAIEDVPGSAPSIIYADGYTKVGKKIVIDDQNNVGYPLSNTAKQVVIGDPNPKFLMGFGNTFSFGKLSLYSLIDWKFKGDVWDGTRGSLNAIGRTAETGALRNTSTVFQGLLGHINSNGDLVHYAADGVTELPGAGAANSQSVVLNQAWYQGDGGGFGNLDQQFIEDGSYVKLREATITYDFKELLFGKSSSSFVKTFSVGAFVRNVIIWTPYKGVDPETNLLLGNSVTSGGIDYFNNPGTKVVGFNLKVKF